LQKQNFSYMKTDHELHFAKNRSSFKTQTAFKQSKVASNIFHNVMAILLHLIYLIQQYKN
jgi:hypothetical protein